MLSQGAVIAPLQRSQRILHGVQTQNIARYLGHDLLQTTRQDQIFALTYYLLAESNVFWTDGPVDYAAGSDHRKTKLFPQIASFHSGCISPSSI